VIRWLTIIDIQFNTRVDKVEPPVTKDGQWKVTTTKLTENGDVIETSTSLFDAVCVCSGHHWNPNMASFPGEEEFTNNGGKIMHSHYYKKSGPFADKKVVIVGMGNSAADLSVEVQVCISLYSTL
jgi:dimethylaniline monooxygenase (N-oxide forming)